MAQRNCGRYDRRARASTRSGGAGGAHLNRQLLPAVPLAPENPQIFFTPFPNRLGDPRPGEAGGVPGPVGQLVKKGRVVGLRGGEPVRCRHGDPVAGRVVGRLARADPGPVAGDEVLAGGDRPDLARLLDLDALALREVEDLVVADQRPVALERHRHLLAVLICDLLRVVGGPEDHHAARLLPTPDVAARPPDLVVGAPPGVAGEEEAVDPPVGFTGGDVHRGEALPGLPPGDGAGLKGGEDPVPDHLIDRYHASGPPLVAARRADVGSDHRVGAGRSPEGLPLPVRPAVLFPDDGAAPVAGGRYHSSPLRRGTSTARGPVS